MSAFACASGICIDSSVLTGPETSPAAGLKGTCIRNNLETPLKGSAASRN